ncbi:probable undecaprenyl phosphate galactosephosphotransferase [Clostridium sp. CAG:389]|nr:probable undecaprenyl phosphate galactosephosphotransferase [Clostridium sp. CAG:389]
MKISLIGGFEVVMKVIKDYGFSNEQAINEIVLENDTINNKKIGIYIEKGIKRIFDIFVGLIGILLLIPITIGIYIAKKILKEDDGPIFYDQLRIGKGGKHFKLYKYRSMIVGADEILKEYLANNEEARIEFEQNQKLKNDPRITKLGNFLRKTSLDEFPQFINILKGDMSLVGPRPIVDREIELFGDEMKTVHSVRPGLTGYWAANGRSDTTYEQRVKMEAYYAENFSLLLDIKIIVKTIKSVIKKEGAV